MNSLNRFRLSALTSALALSGCFFSGGGGDPDTPATATALTLSGTAATGAAVAGGVVVAQCATGTADGTTSTDGTYSLSITGGALPCMARVTGVDSDGDPVDLYTVVAGSGSSATANITPMTQLVVASLSGGDPAAFFTAFAALDSTAAAAAVSSTTMTAATTAVVDMLTSAGITLPSGIDLISGALTAAVGGTGGNPYDVALDALATTLASSGTSLVDLTTTVAATSPAAPTNPSAPVTTGATASLPANLLLRPAANNCSALRSGTYRMVSPAPGTALADMHGKIVVDASTTPLGITFTDNTTGHWAPHGTDACRYTDVDDGADIVVSQAGVIVARSPATGGSPAHLAFGFPEQTLTLAELAGTYNFLGMDHVSATHTFTGYAGTLTFSSTGVLSDVSVCQNDATWSVMGSDCTNETTSGLPTLQVNNAGGFSWIEGGDSPPGQVFAYRAGGGALMLFEVLGDGGFSVSTKQRPNDLPTVGVVSTSWSVSVDELLAVPGALSASSNTIESIDSVARSWVRIAKNVGGINDHPETILANEPRDGYTFRASGSSTVVGTSTTTTFREFTALGLRGMGVSTLLLPSLKQYLFSVNQP